MSVPWDEGGHPQMPAFGVSGWLRVVRRGLPLVALLFGGLALLLTCRLIERPLCGLRRPVTPFITQGVCRGAFFIMGMGFSYRGRPMAARGAVVANHSSWLDIFALNVAKRIYFVSKSEVAGWPGIGWLARATGTLFIVRDPAQARHQTQVFAQRLLAGHRLLFFPEGTSTDGQRVLPFKTALFDAFFAQDLKFDMQVQPVAVVYRAPPGEDPRFYGWWGDMEFGPHLLATLALRRPGAVEVIYCAPLRVANFDGRKALAAATQAAVRAAHAEALRAP